MTPPHPNQPHPNPPHTTNQRRILPTALLTALTILATGIGANTAYAYWQATGTGTATGTTDTPTPVTLGPATPTADLYPGATTNVELTATNTNLFPVRIGSLALDTSQGTAGFNIDAGHPDCNPTALTFTTSTNSGTGWTIPAKIGAVNGTLPITLTNALTMNTNAANACQNATATTYLAAGP